MDCKIFYLVGPSGSGKDTIYKELLDFFQGKIKPITPYTTRPKRNNEIDGVTYNFITKEKFDELLQSGKVIEFREYDVIVDEKPDKWVYATIDDGHIDLNNNYYLAIGTLVSLAKMREYFGTDTIVPIFLQVNKDIRLERLISRELSGKENFHEMWRRWFADKIDFSEENIQKVQPITIVFNDKDTKDTVFEVVRIIINNIL